MDDQPTINEAAGCRGCDETEFHKPSCCNFPNGRGLGPISVRDSERQSESDPTCVSCKHSFVSNLGFCMFVTCVGRRHLCTFASAPDQRSPAPSVAPTHPAPNEYWDCRECSNLSKERIVHLVFDGEVICPVNGRLKIAVAPEVAVVRQPNGGDPAQPGPPAGDDPDEMIPAYWFGNDGMGGPCEISIDALLEDVRQELEAYAHPEFGHGEPIKLTVTTGMMKRKDYDALPDFEGY